MRILIKLPSRSRPEKLLACIHNIIEMWSGAELNTILLTLDTNDATVNNPEFKAKLAKLPVIVDWGISYSKIHAVNRGIPNEGWDVIILTSDDMKFVMKDFDNLIRTKMPDNLDAVLLFPDGYNHGEILSLPVMGKKAYDRDLFIYNPAYISLFCDEEAIHVAEARRILVRCPDLIVKHQHPANDASFKGDAQLIYTQKFHSLDQKTYFKRKAMNFGVK